MADETASQSPAPPATPPAPAAPAEVRVVSRKPRKPSRRLLRSAEAWQAPAADTVEIDRADLNDGWHRLHVALQHLRAAGAEPGEVHQTVRGYLTRWR